MRDVTATHIHHGLAPLLRKPDDVNRELDHILERRSDPAEDELQILEHLHRLRLNVACTDDLAVTVDRDLATYESSAAALRNGDLRVHAQRFHSGRIDEFFRHLLFLRTWRLERLQFML